MASGTGNLPNPGMDFTPFDILTAEEMDDLVENIESLADGSGIGDGAVTADKISGIWWEEIGRLTLQSASDIMSVPDLPVRKYLKVLVTAINSGSINVLFRFNGDTGNNYTRRYSTNNAADTTGSATDSILTVTSAPTTSFTVVEIMNIANREKLLIGQAVAMNTAGTGANPDKFEVSGKWVNTSAAITRIDVVNGGTGDYAIGSEVIILGHD